MYQTTWQQHSSLFYRLENLNGHQTLDEQAMATSRSSFKIWGKWVVVNLFNIALLGFPKRLGLKVNGKLDIGTQKVIDATKALLKPQELIYLNVDSYKTIKASLKQLQIVVKRDGGSLGNEVEHTLRKFKAFKTAIVAKEALQNEVQLCKQTILILSNENQQLTRKFDSAQKRINLLSATNEATISQKREAFLDGICHGGLKAENKFIASLKEFYPEINGYIDEKVTYSPESTDKADEATRTILSALGFFRMYKGDYVAFVNGQADADKMSEEQFRAKQQELRKRYSTSHDLDVFFTTISIHDLGKVGQEDFAFHDEALLQRMKHAPETLPSFARQPKAIQSELILAWEKAALFPQILQLEADSASTKRAAGLHRESPRSFYLFNDHDYFDLYGARLIKSIDVFDNSGNKQIILVNPLERGSATMTRETHENFENAIKLVEQESSNPNFDAYQAIVEFRANQLGLDSKDPVNYAAIRLCAMNLQFTPKAGTAMITRLEKLRETDPQAFDYLVKGLNRSRLDPALKQVLVYYAPALLRNLSNGENGEDQNDAFTIGLRILGYLFHKIVQHLGGLENDNQEFMVNIRQISMIKGGRRLTETNLKDKLLGSDLACEINVNFSSRMATINLSN